LKAIPPVLIIMMIAAVLLLAGILVFDRIPRDTPDEDDWYVAVKGTVRNGGDFRIDELRDLSEVEFTMSLLGTNEDGRDHRYRGIALGAILDHCIPGNGSTEVTVKASDAYSTSFTLAEANAEGIYLVWEKDGKALKPRSEGGPGPVRLLVSQEIAGEYNAQRCVKYVSEVIVE
jgi:DMSO/TMAO reductase YedYZ molybdopterin-dependent catalytic subunit